MLREIIIKTKIECITFKTEEENFIYLIESRKKKKINESKKISNVNFL